MLYLSSKTLFSVFPHSDIYKTLYFKKECRKLKKKKRWKLDVFFERELKTTTLQCLWRSSSKSVFEVWDNGGFTADLQEDSIPLWTLS